MNARESAFYYAAQAQMCGYTAQVLSWHCAMDNYEPVPRKTSSGYAVKFRGMMPTADGLTHERHEVSGITMFCEDTEMPLGNAIGSVALFDYGSVVYPYYVAGWNARETDLQRDPQLHWGKMLMRYVIWNPFPVAADGDLDAKGRPLDYGTWQLGPRKAYHFKISPVA